MPITHPLPDFELAASARYWDAHVSQDHQNIPGNVVAVMPHRCDNPDCSTGCPGVTMIVRVGPVTIEIQFDAEAGFGLSTMMAHSAMLADPKLKEGAN